MDCSRCKRRLKSTETYYLRRYGLCIECLQIVKKGETLE
jgi:recombinational DNA repair protein (RecF pathway)